MPHDNATATNLLATHCAVCGRALVDAQSVETGIGPVCRERYGNFTALTEEARVEANGLVYRVAATLSSNPGAEGLASVAADLQRLSALGADTIVARILANRGRLASIKILTHDNDDSSFAISAPRNEDATAAYRQIPGRRWHGAQSRRSWNGVTKVNSFPRSSWPQVVAALVANYGGSFVRLPGGEVAILSADMAPGFDVPAATEAPVERTTITISEYLYGTRRRISVTTPYDAEVVAHMRSVTGRRWDRASRTNTFPASSLPSVLRIVSDRWPEAVVVAPAHMRTAVADAFQPGAAVAAPAPTPAARVAADMATLNTSGAELAPAAADGWLNLADAACRDYAPAVAYDNDASDHRAWMAESLTHCLKAAGFGLVVVRGSYERVYGIKTAAGTVLVYTAISGESMQRGRSPLRVSIVDDAPSVVAVEEIAREGTMADMIRAVFTAASSVLASAVAA